MDMQSKNLNQIIRFDGRNVFFEVMSNAFTIGKVQINFIEYDTTAAKGNRQKHNIPIFIDMQRFLVLAQDILSGRMEVLAERAREEQVKSGYNHCREVWYDQGGASAKRLMEKGKPRADGKSLARQFKITPGNKMPWIISGEHGDGEEDAKGLIVPKYGNKPEEIVRVPLTEEGFREFAVVTMLHIQAYINSQYMGVVQSKMEALKCLG